MICFQSNGFSFDCELEVTICDLKFVTHFKSYIEVKIQQKKTFSTSFFVGYAILNISLSVIVNELQQRCNLDLEVFDFG